MAISTLGGGLLDLV